MHSKQKTVRDVARLLSSLEQPLDAQIARKLILYTHEAREAKSIWEYAWDQPLTTDPVVAWKYSNLLHRLLRDAHPQAIQDSLREFSKLKYLCECWMQNAHNFTGIGHCVTHYMLLLMQKMQLHANYSHLNGRLEVFGEDKHDVNTCFQLCADLLDLMESTLRLQQAILTEIQQNGIQFDSNAGKCRLVVLITIAQEYEDVYTCVLYSMRKLCCELSMDDVSGLRERFEMLFGQLHLAFQDLQCISYVMDIVKLPVLPANLPTIFNYVRDVNPEPIPSAPLAYDIDY